MLPNDGRVVSNFIVSAISGDPLTIYGDGSQTRSFCYVDDLINGMILLMNSSYSMPVNLGNPDEFTVKDLAKILIKKVNPDGKLIYKNLPEDDPLRRKPDIKVAKNVLNWEPSITLSEGLDKTIKYFKNYLKNEK